MLRQWRGRNDNNGKRRAQNARGPHVGHTIRNSTQNPICSANGNRTNYPPNRKPPPTRVVQTRTQRKVESLSQLPTLHRRTEKNINSIVPDTYIGDISQQFFKLQGVTPYESIKH